VGEFRPFRRGNPPGAQTIRLDPAECQELSQKTDPLVGCVITIQVMAFPEVSPAHKNAVYPLLEGPQDMVRRHAGRAHHANRSNIARVLQSTNPSQVSSGVCSPRTQKTHDLRLKTVFRHEETS